MKARTRTRAPWTAGRTGVSLALAATTVAAMTVPAGAVGLAHPAPTAGATALAPVLMAPQRAAETYRVRAGDTVEGIARRTGTSVSAIVAANNLRSDALIKVGQVLRLPSGAQPAARAGTTTPAATTTHTVAAGDTVSALAKRYGTTVAAIVSANQLNSRALIAVGQRLTIPGSDATSGSSSGAPTSTTAAQTHVVRAGDTVSGLTKRYGTTVSRIISANGLNNAGLIHVGQHLTVSGSAAAGTGSSGARTTPVSNRTSSAASRTHVVRSGDTVSGIAKGYGTTVSAITASNKLGNAGVIHIGQRLTVPGGSGGSGASSGGSGQQLVGSTFLGRTYAGSVVSAANTNKATLLSMDVPSRDRMRAMVRDTAVRMGVNPALALAIAHQESGFDARAVSPANAVGVMQVIPSSGEWASNLVGRSLNLLDPQDNVTAGVAILRQLVRTADNLDQAVAGYYQGLAGVKRKGMYADTRNYVANIRSLMRQF